MKAKKLYLLIIIFSLIVSCSNPSTNPNNNNNNTSSVKAVTSGVHTVQYGSKTSEVDAADKNNLKNLWFGLVGDQLVYNSKYDNKEKGKFDAQGNYFDSTDAVNIRTKFIECGVYEYNNKKYLAGIYWDTQTGVGMQQRYRLIITDENGAEQAWYGGGGDESVLPDENTIWTKYDFVFGYIQNF